MAPRELDPNLVPVQATPARTRGLVQVQTLAGGFSYRFCMGQHIFCQFPMERRGGGHHGDSGVRSSRDLEPGPAGVSQWQIPAARVSPSRKPRRSVLRRLILPLKCFLNL